MFLHGIAVVTMLSNKFAFGPHKAARDFFMEILSKVGQICCAGVLISPVFIRIIHNNKREILWGYV